MKEDKDKMIDEKDNENKLDLPAVLTLAMVLLVVALFLLQIWREVYSIDYHVNRAKETMLLEDANYQLARAISIMEKKGLKGTSRWRDLVCIWQETGEYLSEQKEKDKRRLRKLRKSI